MDTTLSPAQLRLSATPPSRRVNAAVAAVKGMSINELRAELSARRSTDTATRVARQRAALDERAQAAADRLRSL